MRLTKWRDFLKCLLPSKSRASGANRSRRAARAATTTAVETLELRVLPAAVVFSIKGINPPVGTTDATSVSYAVVFDSNVVGVDASDFRAVTTGSVQANGVIVVTPDDADHSLYTVTITGLSGTGDVRLDLIDDDSISHEIPDSEEEPLGGLGTFNGSFQGSTYHLLPALPTVVSIDRDIPPDDVTYATSISYTVTFSTDVTGVDADDFRLALTGTTVDAPISVTGSGATYTVTLSGISGNGSVGLNLVDDGTIRDLLGNPLAQSQPTAAFQPPQAVDFGNPIISLATGDFNRDGNLDLAAIVAGATSNSVAMALGNGDGTFQTPFSGFYPVGGDPRIVTVQDINGDGLSDVIVAFAEGTSVVTYTGNGDGTFSFPMSITAGSNPTAMVIANLNFDGIPEVITVSPSNNTVNVSGDSGNGYYETVAVLGTGANPSALFLGDFDGDGYRDIAVSNKGANTVSVFMSAGGDGFRAPVVFAVGNSPSSVTGADVNGDGILDLITANKGSDDVSVLLGIGDGTFSTQLTYPAGVAPSSVATTDLNGDGRADIVVANSSDNNIGVLMGNGDGTFQNEQNFPTGSGPVVVAIGDINGDGRADVVTADQLGTGATVLLNAVQGDFTGEVYNRSNSNPTITSTNLQEVPENTPTTTTVLQLTATDYELPGQTLVFGMTGVDAEQFNLDPATGIIRFNNVPDFEHPTDSDQDNQYHVQISVSDGYGGTNTQDVVIKVNPLNDNLPVFTSSDTAFVAENLETNYVVIDVDATDDDQPAQTVTYSLSGTDSDKFSIDENTGEIRFLASPDFEAPDDENGDNVYDLIVTADDGLFGVQTQVLTISVYGYNDNTPIITSSDTVDVPENTPESDVILIAAATDADLPAPSLYYDLLGIDAALFTIDHSTGEIHFIASPDYESPLDYDGDNVYEVTLAVYDGGEGYTPQDLTIRVQPINDNAPIIEAVSSASIDENSPASTVIVNVAATDLDQPAQGLTYRLSGDDAAWFSISPTGEIRFLNSPDYETPNDLDENNLYELIVTVTDKGVPSLSSTHNLTISVTDINDPPIAYDDTLAVLEDTATNGQLPADDFDVEETLTFIIVKQPDHGTLELTDIYTGEYTYTPDLDYTGPDSFQFKTNDGQFDSNVATVAITVSAVNSPPVLLDAILRIPENSPNGTVVGTVTADDPDVVPGPGSDVLTYSITGGNLLNAFSIDPSNGEIRVSNSAALNYEVLQQFVLQVTVTDLASHSTSASITVNVLNVNEPLIITLPNSPPIYHKDGTPTPIDPNASVYDADLTPIEFRGGILTITVTTTGEPDPNDRLSVEVQGTGAGKISLVSNYIVYDSPLNIIGTVESGQDGGPLVIHLTSFANEESVGALLRTINFYNTSSTPSPGTRTITFDLTDGPGENSGTQIKQIEVITVSDPPVVTLPGGDLNVPLRSSPTSLGASATITDPDSTSFKGGQLLVTAIQSANRSDRLRILNTGGIKVKGKDVLFNGEKIGRLTKSKNSIKVDFTSNSATPAAVQALLRAVAFSTSRNRSAAGTREYQIVLSDGDGGRQTTSQRVVVS